MNVSDLIDRVDDFEKLTQKEQVKLIAFFHCVEYSKEFFTTTDIKAEFEKHSLSLPANVSNEVLKLKKEKPAVLISGKSGLSFQRKAKKGLEETYLGTTHKREISTTLRDLLQNVSGKEQKSFLEEAITCFEVKSFRASILMVWLLTIDTIYEHVLQVPNIAKFNNAIQAHGKYKKITINKKEDFSDIKESDFIELLRVAKLISNDTRKILDEKLGIRNSCAHPNTLVIEDYKAIAFIQDLVKNVIEKI
ncbi:MULTISPECIES: hypothetical protein [Aequorivita]|uniref:DUF4145 domain-containing protein n=1 Tax=Aequorivita iocasae TaxID=2803865 RepID=A0ABX7DSE9_9FLAO|nr:MULTISPECIES: hypothetical protein [Aequorivita]QQX76397.1 hypothetical protein JK629_13880 [Aequorivita iocasae]UCA55866.1 hypothetical protein LDL78_13950 [Aequorivita sp. F7]